MNQCSEKMTSVTVYWTSGQFDSAINLIVCPYFSNLIESIEDFLSQTPALDCHEVRGKLDRAAIVQYCY